MICISLCCDAHTFVDDVMSIVWGSSPETNVAAGQRADGSVPEMKGTQQLNVKERLEAAYDEVRRLVKELLASG